MPQRGQRTLETIQQGKSTNEHSAKQRSNVLLPAEHPGLNLPACGDYRGKAQRGNGGGQCGDLWTKNGWPALDAREKERRSTDQQMRPGGDGGHYL